jgi:hypothetical protein
MAIKLEDIEIFSNSLGNNFGGGGFFGGASSGGGTNLTGIPNADYLQNLANLFQQQQQQGPQLGPDDFGSYTIPVSDPTYRSGFDYARSIAGGIPMSQVIAPGVSYSPEQPMGYTQEQLNRPKDMPAPPPPPRSIDRRGDDVDFLGTGIGGVNIPVDRKQDFPPLSNLLNIGKLFGGGFDKDAIEKIVQERIAESKKIQETKPDMPTFIPEVPTGRDFSIDREILERPMISGLENRDFMDADSLITGVPTGRDFSIDREELIKDIREGIEVPKYEMPDLSQFARLEDIPTVPTLDREALIRDITGRIDIPKPPSIDRQLLIEDIRSGIELPTYQAPDLSGFARLEDIPSFDPNILKQDILMSLPQTQVPDVSQFVTQEDIQKAISGIDMPTFQQPNLSAYDTRIAELEQQLAGLQTPTGGRFSVDQQLPMGLFV